MLLPFFSDEKSLSPVDHFTEEVSALEGMVDALTFSPSLLGSLCRRRVKIIASRKKQKNPQQAFPALLPLASLKDLCTKP